MCESSEGQAGRYSLESYLEQKHADNLARWKAEGLFLDSAEKRRERLDDALAKLKHFTQ